MSTALESWYRRLIGLYPGGHRAVYAEDMVAVLMVEARPGQDRPQLRTVVDLLRGAGQAWALRLRTRTHAWQRTRLPAALSLLALLLLCIRSITAATRLLMPDHVLLTPYDGWLASGVMLPDLIWLPVTVAAVVGLRRPAAWAAWGVGVGWPLFNTVVGVSGWAPSFLGSLDRFVWLPVALIAAAGLGVDGRVGQGIRALGRSGGGMGLAGVVMLGLTMSVPPRVVVPPGSIDVTDPSISVPSLPDRFAVPLLATALALLVLASARVVARTGRNRALATLVAVAIPLLLSGVHAGRDGVSWYAHLIPLIDIALPLTLVMCTLIAGWSTTHAVDQASPRQNGQTAP